MNNEKKNNIIETLEENNAEVCTKKDLVDLVTKLSNTTQKLSTQMVDNVLYGIELILQKSKSHKLNLREWGTFSITFISEPRKYRNPKTGAVIIKKTSSRCSFKPGKKLKDIALSLSKPSI